MRENVSIGQLAADLPAENEIAGLEMGRVAVDSTADSIAARVTAGNADDRVGAALDDDNFVDESLRSALNVPLAEGQYDNGGQVSEGMPNDYEEEDDGGAFEVYYDSEGFHPISKKLRDKSEDVNEYVKRKDDNRYAIFPDGLVKEYETLRLDQSNNHVQSSAKLLLETLSDFNIKAEVTAIRYGPVITMFELLPAPGVKLTKITGLADNIALRLAAASVRIVAPIPGKEAIGIEIPNAKRQTVGFGDLIRDAQFSNDTFRLPIALGRDVQGTAKIIDLTRTPHLLIAGATGTGKSVGINCLICSLLFSRSPRDIRLLLIDPKIVELKLYDRIPHLLTPVVTSPKRAIAALKYCIFEMERRYNLLDALGARDITTYNRRIKERGVTAEHLPYWVIVIDEFADLMITGGKEIESLIARLAAMARAVGMHLVLATQRPSTEVITGLIKANIPSRISFMVSSKIDSRIIIDTGGAESLLGQGDMLFVSSLAPNPERIQGALLTEEEVENIAGATREYGLPDYIDEAIFDDEESETKEADSSDSDALFSEARAIVEQTRKASASYLQRRLKIGYNRAARIIDIMEQQGIVGPPNGSKSREILL